MLEIGIVSFESVIKLNYERKRENPKDFVTEITSNHFPLENNYSLD